MGPVRVSAESGDMRIDFEVTAQRAENGAPRIRYAAFLDTLVRFKSGGLAPTTHPTNSLPPGDGEHRDGGTPLARIIMIDKLVKDFRAIATTLGVIVPRVYSTGHSISPRNRPLT